MIDSQVFFQSYSEVENLFFQKKIKSPEFINTDVNTQFWEYFSSRETYFFVASVRCAQETGLYLKGGRDPFMIWKLPWSSKLFLVYTVPPEAMTLAILIFL